VTEGEQSADSAVLVDSSVWAGALRYEEGLDTSPDPLMAESAIIEKGGPFLACKIDITPRR
jgi:hypothetical protein